MAYVVWKLNDGRGPYAYLWESYRKEGKPRSRHLRYLGKWGQLAPGTVVAAPDGSEVVVPDPAPSLLERRSAGGGPARSGRVETTAQELLPDAVETTVAGPPAGGAGNAVETTDMGVPAAGLVSTAAPAEGPVETTVDDVPGEVMETTGRPHRLADGSWGAL